MGERDPENEFELFACCNEGSLRLFNITSILTGNRGAYEQQGLNHLFNTFIRQKELHNFFLLLSRFLADA